MMLLNSELQTIPPTSYFPDNQKSGYIFKKLFEWSHRAKTIECSRQVKKALSKQDDEFRDENLLQLLESECVSLVEKVDWRGMESKERKRVNAVLELFYSELVFLHNKLLVLRNVFQEPLKNCQVEGYMVSIEPSLLFGNLTQLCQGSFRFCKHFAAAFQESLARGSFASTEAVVAVFSDEFNGSPLGAYSAYCINYKGMLEYLEKIRKSDDRFVEFEKLCSCDSRCHRLQLQDFLIAPLHRITRLPLLLREVLKYTESQSDINNLSAIIDKFDVALKSIDDSIQWLYNFEQLQELQSQLVWPTVAELEQKAFIPEFMRLALSKQFCEKLLAHPRRKLIHEGTLYLTENQRNVEVYAFLFNDMFLVTKCKKSTNKAKRATSGCILHVMRHPGNKYVVQKQPVPLDCCVFCDVSPEDAGNSGLKHGFVILHLTRFCQVIALFTLQAPTKEAKKLWINKFQESIENYESIQLKDMIKCTSALLQNGLRSACSSARSSPRGSLNNLNLEKSPAHSPSADTPSPMISPVRQDTC